MWHYTAPTQCGQSELETSEEMQNNRWLNQQSQVLSRVFCASVVDSPESFPSKVHQSPPTS